MNDILFGNNNTKTIKRLSKQYFKKKLFFVTFSKK